MEAVRDGSGLRWVAAFGFAILAAAWVATYLVAMNALDQDTDRAPVVLQVVWWLCALGAVAAAVAAGARGGLIRALIASALVWGGIATGVYFLLGPTCPLSAIGPNISSPVGMPPVRLQESFNTLCSVSGTVAGSVDARWALGTGALATMLAALGGLTALVRSAVTRRREPAGHP